jgi:hypothetical protein
MNRKVYRYLLATIGTLLGLALLQPAAASASSNAGGGAITGTAHFGNGGVPPLFAPAAPSSFTISGTAPAVTFNTVITGYAGAVTIAGTGGASKESTPSGSGTLTLTDVHGSGPTGSSLVCADPLAGTTLSGGYTRVGTDVEAVLSGNCTINGFTAGVSFIFRGQFAPTNQGGGTSAPITDASFAGAFVVQPA